MYIPDAVMLRILTVTICKFFEIFFEFMNFSHIRDIPSSTTDPELAAQVDGSLKIAEHTSLTSATKQSVKVGRTELSQDICQHLPDIRATYLSSAQGFSASLVKSR